MAEGSSERSEQMQNALDDFLNPMLNSENAGTKILGKKSGKKVSSDGPAKLKIAPEQNSKTRVLIHRSQYFTDEEKKLCESFQEKFNEIADDNFYEELKHGLPQKFISSYLSQEYETEISNLISILTDWASQTYEGHPITVAFGFSPENSNGANRITELKDSDFLKLLSNGFDTILELDSELTISEHLSLSESESVSNNHKNPYRLRHIAEWSSHEESRIGLVLNRHGEILIFRKGELLFAKRRGRWKYFPHDQVIKDMSPPNEELLRETIHGSCLDVSFARVGGCIAVKKSTYNSSNDNILGDLDRLENPSENKTKVLSTIVKDNTFKDLPRQLRSEFLAMDGATILDHQGNIISAGQIVEVDATAEGGGRTAAAIKLSELGLGIKISEDGTITAFKNGESEPHYVLG